MREALRHRTASVLAALLHATPGALRRNRDRSHGRLRLEPVAGETLHVQGRRHHHPRAPASVAYLYLLFKLWVVNAIDLALTVHYTDAVGAGWGAEGNAVMRAVAEAGGVFGFALYKLMLMTLVVLVLWWLYLQVEDRVHEARYRHRQRRALHAYRAVVGATFLLSAFYMWVIWNNLRVMGYL